MPEYTNRRITNVENDRGLLLFKRLNHVKVVSDFIRELNNAIDQGYKSIDIDFRSVSNQFFPCAIVPISGIIEELKSRNFEVEVLHHPLTRKMGIEQPETYSGDDSHIFNRVWKFDKTNYAMLGNDFIRGLTKEDQFSPNALTFIDWALNEVIDNVLNHSGKDCGLVMGQIHPSSKHISFCVFDSGMGMKASFLAGGLYKPRTQADAISMAIQEGVTSDKSKGQGNGLFGLHSLVKQGDGRLNITSGYGGYSYQNNNCRTYDNLPSFRKLNRFTTIDFIIDYAADYSVENVLQFNGKPYKPTCLRIEKMEDERGNIPFKIRELGDGTGTRSAAIRIKNQIMNILSEEPRNIILDFEGIGTISSSYSDELIAKLLVDLGLFQFNQLIRIRNLNETQQTILQRSVIQRIIDNYK